MSEPASDDRRSIELHDRRSSLLMLVDVQEKLLPAIPVRDQLVSRCQLLIAGAQLLSVPMFATEQYPRGLGPTVATLRELLPAPTEKLHFSSVPALQWPAVGDRDDDRTTVVVCGLEAHVCVLQTACDLLSLGYRVTIPADAVASRRKLDWQIALQRLAGSGATITTVESVLFEWCETAAAPEFKALIALIKSSDQPANPPRLA